MQTVRKRTWSASITHPDHHPQSICKNMTRATMQKSQEEVEQLRDGVFCGMFYE